MNDTTIIAVLAAIPTIIASIAALFVSLRNSSKTNEALHKSDVIIEKTNEIHTLANSNLSKAVAALQVANEKIAGQDKLMAQMREAKLDTAEVTERQAEIDAAARAKLQPGGK